MKIKFCCFFLLFLFLSIKLLSTNSRNDYIEYYKAINEAELLIVDFDFKLAYNKYRITFNHYEKRQINDLHNATLCAIRVGEFNQAQQWIMEMITKGATLERFSSGTFKLLPEKNWNDIKLLYKALRSEYLNLMDLDYKAILDTIRKKEQFYAQYETSEKFDSLLYENAKVISQIVNTNGVPKVCMFEGYKLPLDAMRHFFGLRNRLLFHQKNGIDITRHPYNKMELSSFNLEPTLVKAIYSGELPPYFVAMCMEHSELDSARQLFPFSIVIDFNTKTIKYEYSQPNIESIENHRNYLALEPLNDAIRKNYEIALYYNQISYPFDEHLDRFKKLGFNNSKIDSLSIDEKNKMLFSFMGIVANVKSSYLRNMQNTESNEMTNAIQVNKNFTLLNEFKIQQSTCKVIIIPPS